MPNYCDYKMRVRGVPTQVDQFIAIIQAEDYDQRHLYRVFNADIINQSIDVFGLKTVIIGGYCAWSVYSCMMEGPFTYYDYSRNDEHPADPTNMGTSLIIESKRLGLLLEVYSDEPGIGFQEHICIGNGNILADECVDCNTYWIGDYDTYQDWIKYWYDNEEEAKKHNVKLTKEIFDDCKKKEIEEYKDGGFEVNNEFIFQTEHLPQFPMRMVLCKIK